MPKDSGNRVIYWSFLDFENDVPKVSAFGRVESVGKKQWLLSLFIRQLLYCWLVLSFIEESYLVGI